jgi:DnaJ-class molecular chaperone
MAKAETCMPCRGTGRVISNLGDKPQEVTCPWCAGDGVRLQGIDAQASWLEKGAAHSGARHGAS